jgi:hypothetical protein
MDGRQCRSSEFLKKRAAAAWLWRRRMEPGRPAEPGPRANLHLVDVDAGVFQMTAEAFEGSREPFGATVMVMEYDSYEDDLSPDVTLFERPVGAGFVEAGR